MLFYQQYTVEEYLFGPQTIRFAVSDNYNDLFNPLVGIETDIFLLESVKEDLNTEEGSFAIDELSFSVKHLSCKNDTDEQALFFCLDSADVRFNRYVAVFFGSDPSVTNMLFIGKLSDKISGQDQLWNTGSFITQTDAKREYKFNAYSFDISILEEVKISQNINHPLTGAEILNLNERWKTNSLQAYQNIFKQRIAYYYYHDDDHTAYKYFMHLGNLYDVLTQYLIFAEEIINEKNGIALSMDLPSFDLNLSARSTKYGVNTVPGNQGFFYFTWGAEQTQDNYKLRMNSGDIPGGGITYPHINIKMVDPELFNDPEGGSEQSFSFSQFDNLAELLFEIAKTFGCYVFFSFATGTQIYIEFKPRSGIIATDYTYIIGAKDASINSSSISTSNKNRYYSIANNRATDGFDTFMVGKVSDNIQLEMEARESEKKKKNIEYEKILFSGSPTMLTVTKPNLPDLTIPMNFVSKTTLNESFDRSLYSDPHKIGPPPRWPEYLHNSLYIPVYPAPEPEVDAELQSPVFRPASGFMAEVDGSNRVYDKLSEYLNEIMSRDVQYYETEYSLTVPFWNGFSSNPSESGASWRNIKRGSKIRLSETMRRFEPRRYIESISSDGFGWATVVHTGHGLTTGQTIRMYDVVPSDYNGTFVITVIDEDSFTYETITGYTGTGTGGYYVLPGEWDEGIVARDYVVVGIERSLSSPETKLKLHNLSRFAYGDWGGNPEDLPVITSIPNSTLISDDGEVREYTISTGMTITAGDAVQLADDGTIFKAVNIDVNYGKTIGIALNSGSDGEAIQVKISGLIYNENYNFDLTEPWVFLRKSNDSNISQISLNSATADENTYIYLGKVASSKSFILNIDEWVFN